MKDPSSKIRRIKPTEWFPQGGATADTRDVRLPDEVLRTLAAAERESIRRARKSA